MLLRHIRTSSGTRLRRTVKNYFLGQLVVESGKPWPFGECITASPVLLQAYGEVQGMTAVNNDQAIVGPTIDDPPRDHALPPADAQPLEVSLIRTTPQPGRAVHEEFSRSERRLLGGQIT
jgi:hypothetical protein